MSVMIHACIGAPTLKARLPVRQSPRRRNEVFIRVGSLVFHPHQVPAEECGDFANAVWNEDEISPIRQKASGRIPNCEFDQASGN